METTEPLKQRWLDALRSGQYTQTMGALRNTYNTIRDSYCCLGVLCDIYDNSKWEQHDITWSFGHFGAVLYTGIPPAEVLNAAGISRVFAGTLAEQNDKGVDFETIAKMIEGNTLNVQEA